MDLHTHSNCSDGEWTPAELVSEAARAGITIISLTDHDTVAGLAEFERAGADQGIWTIPGLEVSASYDGRPFHILCYGVDTRSKCWAELAAAREDGRELMYDRVFAQVREMGYRLNEGSARNRDGSLVDHPLQAALAGAGHLDPVTETRRLFRPVILSHLVLRSVPVERLGNIIAEEKLLCSIAHPGRNEEGVSSRLSNQDLEGILRLMPLDALEAYHPMHLSSERDYTIELAKRYGLMVTCGSDAHGHRNGRPPIGFAVSLCRPFLETLLMRSAISARAGVGGDI